MAVIRWPKHVRMVCERWPELGGCSTCGGWEGEVPTDCPGAPMTQEQKDAVLGGRLDYFRGEGWSTVTRMQRLKIKRMLEG